MYNFTILFIFILAFFKSLFFSHFGLNFFDYGESLHNGVRLLEGATLYRDVWAFLPPADNYFPAIILAFFNNHLLAVRFMESFLFALLVGLLVFLTRDFLSKKISILMGIALIFSDLNVYLLFFHFFFFISLFLFIKFLEEKRNFWLVWSGIFLGLGTLFRHDTGLGVGATLVLSALLLKKKYDLKSLNVLSYLLIGFLVIITPVFLWLLQQGTLSEFLYLGFVKAPQISGILSPGFNVTEVFSLPFTLTKGFQAFTLVFYGFYLIVYALTGFYLYNKLKVPKFSLKEVTLLSFLLYGIMQIPYAFSVIEMGHLVKAGIPAFPLGAFLIQEGVRQKVWRKFSWALSMPLLIFILGNSVASFWWINYNDTRIDFKQGFVFVNSQHIDNSTHPTAQSLKSTLQFLEDNTEEGEYIFAAPYHAMLYFLSERKAPSRFNNFAAGFVSPEEQDEVISDIEQKDVKIVVYDPVNAPHGKHFANSSPKIHAYLMESFITIEETDMGWLLMRRKGE